MDLKKIQATLDNVRKESSHLDWTMAIYKANMKYQELYILGLSLTYRKTCDWWLEIGDDLEAYLDRNPYLEAKLKSWYFNNQNN